MLRHIGARDRQPVNRERSFSPRLRPLLTTSGAHPCTFPETGQPSLPQQPLRSW